MDDEEQVLVIDGFQQPDGVAEVVDFIFTEGLPWQMTRGTVADGGDSDLLWFNHIFSYNNKIESPFFYKLMFLFEERFSLLGSTPHSIRANLMTPQGKQGLTAFHVDRPEQHFVGIYYVNKCDGPTVLINGNQKEEIEPKPGRLLLMDGSLMHCATLPEKGLRCVINFVFDGDMSAVSVGKRE